MGSRHFAWISIVVAALGSAGPAAVLPALAQYNPATKGSRASDPGLPSIPSRGRPGSTDLGGDGTVPGIPPAIPEDDASQIPEESDTLDPVPRAGQRPVVQDGDLNYPAEPTGPRDGVVDVVEPLPAEDGTDPSTIDTRPPEDLALFENQVPLAVEDPLLFQIEDLDPITDNRRTTRLFKGEPFDPLGIRIGSFVLFPELDIGGTYYSNVFRTPAARSDVAATVLPSARLVSNWTRHALEFRGLGDLSFYNEFDSENNKGYLLETRGRLDILRHTNIEGLVSRDVAQESRSALDASSAGSRANVTTDRAVATLNHRFNRLGLQVRGSVADYKYGDSENLGVVTSSKDRDYTAFEETVRATWELKPALLPFAEVTFVQRNFDTAPASDLINRTSTGERLRAGLSFGNTGQILRGEVSLGYGIETPDDSRLKSVDGLIIDGNATWRASELTSFLFTARSDIQETTTTNVGGSFYRFVSIEARHALRKYLIATAGLSYSTQDSQDGVIDERELRASLGLEYFLSREAVLYTRYAHTSFDAVGADSDYEADEVRFGMRLRR
jgi:hypothetical protein